MTTQPADDNVEPLLAPGMDFTSAPREVTRTLFRIDGEDFYAVKPKAGVLMGLMLDGQAAEGGDEMAQVRIIEAFIDTTLEPDSGDRIRARLEDPDDDFDVDTLAEVITALQGAWGRRPTTPSRRSSRSPRRTGRTSTGARRSPARTSKT